MLADLDVRLSCQPCLYSRAVVQMQRFVCRLDTRTPMLVVPSSVVFLCVSPDMTFSGV